MAERRTSDGMYGMLYGTWEAITLPGRGASGRVMTGSRSFDQGRAERNEKTPAPRWRSVPGSILPYPRGWGEVQAELLYLTLVECDPKFFYCLNRARSALEQDHVL